MFLDEELEMEHAHIHATTSAKYGQFFRIMKLRLPPFENKVDIESVLNTIKQIDNGWRLFCKRHEEYDANFWRKIVLREDTDGVFQKALGW